MLHFSASAAFALLLRMEIRVELRRQDKLRRVSSLRLLFATTEFRSLEPA